jgi:protein ImuB
VAVVLVSHERGADRVQACSAPAARAGVAPGMTLAAARALLPEVLSDRLDPEGEREDLRALAAALVSFTPAVQVAPPAGLVLDVGRAVLPALRRTLLGLGHAARLVHAPDAEVARILAAHLPRDRALTEAEMAPALAPLPVGVLGLDPDVVATLADGGVRTAGQLARLPTSALTSRWGPSLAVAHARASGRALSATPVPTLADAREDSTFHIDFPDPVDVTEAILFVLAGLVRDLCRALERAGRAAVRVQLRLRLEEGEHVLPVRLGRPMRGPDRIFRVLRLRLERVSVTSPVTALTLELAEAAVFRAAQPGLLERAEAAEPLGELCARLQDTLGTDAVFVPVPADRWRPEVAWAPLPVGQSPPPPRRVTGTPRHALDPAGPHEPNAEVRARPPTLLPDPRAIRVAAAPSGRPRAVYLDDQPERRGWLQLDPVDGPERLHGEWWTNSTWKRDYWRVGLPDGRRAWIYREALPGDGDRDIPSQRWWLHGWIDGACGAPEPPPPPG